MNKAWMIAALCSTGLLIACGENTETKQTENTLSETETAVSTGPEFDLLTTPVGEVNFPTTCTNEAGALVERGVRADA